MRKWHKKARDANPEYYFDIYLRKRYKVTIDWYREQFSKQNGVCAICNQPETTVIHGKVISMPVDHDHQNGKARGLLCTKCNRGLGLFRDDIINTGKFIPLHCFNRLLDDSLSCVN